MERGLLPKSPFPGPVDLPLVGGAFLFVLRRRLPWKAGSASPAPKLTWPSAAPGPGLVGPASADDRHASMPAIRYSRYSPCPG